MFNFDFDEYITNIKSPKRNDFSTIYFYKKGVVRKFKDSELSSSESSSLINNGWLVERTYDDAAFKKAKDLYIANKKYLYNKFKKDVAQYLNIDNHSKKELLFKKAEDIVGSRDIEKIYYTIESLVDLL